MKLLRRRGSKPGHVETNLQGNGYTFLKATGGAINQAILDDVTDGIIAEGDLVWTGAYWEGSDLGGASYRVVAASTGTEDGGSYIDAGTVQLEAVFGGHIDIAQFGAKPGGTDNSAVLNAARDALEVLGGGSLVIPEGRWHKTGQWQFYFGCIIGGRSWESVLVQDDDNIAIIFEGEDVGDAIDGAQVRNIAIDMNGNGQLDAGSIVFNNCRQFLCDHVYVHDAGTINEANPAGVGGISMSSGSTDVAEVETTGTVSNCLVERTTKAGYSATYGSQSVTLIGNVARDQQGNGATPGFQINGGHGIKLIGNTSERSEGAGFIIAVNGQGRGPDRFVAKDNTAIDSGTLGAQSANGHGFYIANSGYIPVTDQMFGQIDGNTVINAEQNGIVVQNLSQIDVTANKVIDSRLSSFLVEGTLGTITDIRISNNVGDGGTQGGLFLRGLDQVRISGNRIQNGHSRGLWFFGAVDDVVVETNDLQGSFKAVDSTTAPTNLKAGMNRYTGTSDITDTITF